MLYGGVAELLGFARTRRAARAELGRRAIAASFAPVAVGVLAFAAVLVFLRTGGATAPAAVRTDACNGHVELCSRRLDEVVRALGGAVVSDEGMDLGLAVAGWAKSTS